MPNVTLPDGRTITFPDEMSAREIESTVGNIIKDELTVNGTIPPQGVPSAPQPATTQPSVLESLQAGVTGVTEAAMGPFTFGLAGKVSDMGSQFSKRLTDFIFEDVFGQEPKNLPKRPTFKERQKRFQETNPVASAAASTIGALANPASQRAAKFIEQGLQKAGEFAKPTEEQKREKAGKKVFEALVRDGLTEQEATARMERLGPEAALLDLGDNTRALGFSAANVPGEGKVIIKKFVEDRQIGMRDSGLNIVGGQINRIRDIITDLVPQNAQTEKAKLLAAKSAEALYKQAEEANQFMESPGLGRLLKRPSIQRVLKQVVEVGREEGKNIARVDPELTKLLNESGESPTGVGVARGLKLVTYDRIKKLLWDLEQAQKDKNGKSTVSSRAISQTRIKLTKELDLVDQQTTGGAYAAARLASGDDLANVESLELGNKFMSKSEFRTPEEMGEVISQMTPEGQHFFRVGAANAMKILAQNLNPRGDTTKKLFEQVGLEEKIKLAFGDRELFKKYIQSLTVEKELFKAVTDVLSNSKTAERQESIKDIGIDPGILAQGARDVQSGRLVQGALSLARGLKDRVTMPPTQAKEIAKILIGRNVPRLKK